MPKMLSRYLSLFLLLPAALSACTETSGRPRYYELGLDVSVNGERVRLASYLKCIYMTKNWAGHHVGWTAVKPPTYAVARLSSGGVLLFHIEGTLEGLGADFHCSRESFEEVSIDINPYYFPTLSIWWLDHPANTTRMERFVYSKRAERFVYSDPMEEAVPSWDGPSEPVNMDVILHGFSGRRVTSPDAKAENLVPWLRGSLLTKRKNPLQKYRELPLRPRKPQ